MAKLSHSDSRRMYSWWWDSHISPKNSKWLKENLTDMDAQVKGMIKLLEGDADSFARRAEMYYKKRPEIMKLVEEFYRAYRALAERYDHATGVIRHAHRTMAEHFPNQDQMFADDSPISSLPGTDPRTLDGEFTDEYDSVSRRRSSKQFNNSFGHVDRVRKGLNFDEAEETEGKRSNGNNHIKDRNLSEADPASESEAIRCLKEGLAKLESEKEAGLAQYQQSLDRLSELESEVSKTQESFRLLNDSATKAENEVVILKEALAKLESEKDAKLYDYQKSLGRISDLQSIVASLQEDANKLDGRASSAETEVEALKGELEKLSLEKDEALNQYMGSLDMISSLENKLRLTDEDAQRFRERAKNAESEVETLKQTISKLNEEKEALDLQYDKCLKTISSLEQKLKSAEEEAKCLNLEIENGVSKLKGAEEQCLLLERSNRSLHSEMESLMLKMGTQTQELTEKQKELGRLWACVQEERLRFVEAETAFQTLQHLHAQTQEELRSMGSELQKRAQLLKVAESHTQNLQNEVVKVKEENKHLDEVNAASALSIKDMQTEISSLKDSRGKLEEEVELRTDQRNALQQEIYCLKEELNNLNQKHHLVLDQVEAVGLHPDSLRLSVQELQDKNSKLKETCHRESSEKAALLEKLVILEQLLEKNSILENSLSDLNAELEAVRGTIETLEQSCRSLLEEKSTLLDEKATLELQLQETSESVETLSKNNTVLQNSLADALTQLEALKDKSKILEDSCQLLVCEKASLISEKDGINSELENTRIRLDDLGKIYRELEGRCATLEKEKESTLRKVEELQMSSDAERQEHASYVQISEARFTGLETEVHSLQRECQWRRKELDEVIDNVIYGEVEIFVLRRTSQELAENHLSILVDNEALLEEGSLSKKKILQLEKNNFEQEVEIRSLCDQASSLRVGASQLLKALDIFEDHVSNDETERDKANFMHLLSNIQILKESLCRAEEENQRRAVELMVLVSWVRQLSLDSKNLGLEKSDIERELKFRTEQLLASQGEVLTVLGMNENLKLKLREESCNKEALINQIEDLTWKLTYTQDTCQVLQREKLEITEEKKSLMDKLRLSEEKNNVLEEENYILHGEVVALDNLSLIFRSLANEKFMELRALDDNFNSIQGLNAAFLEKISLTEGKLQESELENIQLQERLQTSEDEMKTVVLIKDQLTHEIENGKEVLHQMELELQEAEQKISLGETEKLELRNILDGFRTEHTEVKAVRDIQETQIFKLSADNDHLQSEMEMKINDINKLEAEAAMIFAQLQYSMVGHLLYEQKFYELQETCICCMDENEELKSQLAAYGPEIVALEECISSLESHTIMHPKVQYPENEEVEGSKVTNAHKSIQNEDEKVPTSVTFSDLVDLRTRLQAVEKAAIEIKESMIEENMDLHTQLDASVKQLELLQSESRRYGRNWKPSSEITEVECATLTKDIMLDQVSDGSCYGLSKRGPADIDNQTIESWETADPDSAIGLTVGKLKKVRTPSISDTCEIRRVSSMRKNKGEYPTSNKLKDLSMDKLDISKRFTEPLPEGNERKVLERLDSDVQKLANLQITVQDLKRKLGVTEKDKRGKAVIQCEALKGQLEEADMAIMKLFDLNGKLMRNVEDGSSFSESKSSFDLEGDKSGRRRRVSEQARRMSEKIGRLQLEIQKLQFVLLKLDSESEGRAKMSESKRRVLLRDYLYGGARKGQRRKKSPFCACVEPSTVD